MKWLRKIGRWIADRLKDLFYGPGNGYADLARILAFVGLMAEVGALLWNISLGKEIDLVGLGGGIAAILTASAGFLAAKAWTGTQHQKALTCQAERERTHD